MLHFVSIAFFLSKVKHTILALNHLLRWTSKIGKMNLVFLMHTIGGLDSAHNKSRQCYVAFKNQRQSVTHVIERGTIKEQQQYKARLIIILGVIRFLMLQALAFRGHDESPSSKNQGNFLEMMKWYKKKDPNARTLLESAGGNHLMTSHQIQLDLCKACAEETTRSIIADIGDRKFSLLVDESRDASIKEQMAMVLRFVACFLFVYLHVS
jgi:hypothetical protein